MRKFLQHTFASFSYFTSYGDDSALENFAHKFALRKLSFIIPRDSRSEKSFQAFRFKSFFFCKVYSYVISEANEKMYIFFLNFCLFSKNLTLIRPHCLQKARVPTKLFCRGRRQEAAHLVFSCVFEIFI